MKRFGRSNGPKLYKLQREVFLYSQGSQSVFMYFNNLCALWDELDMLSPPIECGCSGRSAATRRMEHERLIKFLVGLNDYYEQTRRQIMSLEPLPTVDCTYSMVIQVEDQKLLQEGMVEGNSLMSMNVGRQEVNQAASQPNSQFKRRLSKEEKKKLHCTHCQQSGHEAAECFNLHGIPDWYRRYKDNRVKGRVNYVDNSSDGESFISLSEARDNSADIGKLIQTEMAKCMGNMMQHMSGGAPLKTDTNMVQHGTTPSTPFEGHYAFG